LKSPVIVGIGTAVPDFVITQEEASSFLSELYRTKLSARSLEVLHKVLLHPSVRTRHVAVKSADELKGLKDEDPDRRVARFTKWSIALAGLALQRALEKAGSLPSQITALIVNTCTGYLCPGISGYVMERLGIPKTISAYDLVGSGCGGAIPNLRLAEQIVRGDPSQVVACVSVEICSATFEMDNDMGLIVSNALFGDGAAAAIVRANGGGLALARNASAFFPEVREQVRFIHRNGRLHNQLDSQLPKTIRKTVPGFIRDLLAREGLAPDQIGQWAFHPGGDRVLSAIQEELELSNSAMLPSRNALLAYGNMSSPTVLFVLEDLWNQGIASGEWCAAIGYGAGMSVHGFLMQAR